MPAWQERFNEAIKRINAADSIEELLKAISDTVTGRMGEITSIGLYDQEIKDKYGQPLVQTILTLTENGILSLRPMADSDLIAKATGLDVTQRNRLMIIRDLASYRKADPEAVRRLGLQDTRSLAVLPLTVNGQQVGVLGVASGKPGGFARDDVKLLEAVSEQLAIRLRNLMILKEAEEAGKLFEALYEAAFRLEEGETRGEVLRRAVVELGGILGPGFAIAGYIAGPEPTWPPEWLESAAHHTTGNVEGYTRLLDVGQRIPASPESFPVLNLLKDAHTPFYSPNAPQDERVDDNARSIMEAAGLVSLIMFPLVTRERWLGILTVSSPREHLFSRRYLRQLNGFALRTAAIMESRWLLHRQIEANRLMENLIRLSRSIVFSPDMDKAVHNIANALVSSLDATLVRIWVLDEEPSCTDCQWDTHCADEDRRCLALRASAGLSSSLSGPFARVPIGITTIGKLALSDSPHIEDDFSPDEQVLEQVLAKRGEFGTFMGYPLLVEDKAVGVMAIFAKEKPAKMTLDFLEPFSRQVAGVIANAKMIQNTQERALGEEVLSRASIRWQQSLSLEPLLSTALSELGDFLGARKARIRLITGSGDPEEGDDHPEVGDEQDS